MFISLYIVGRKLRMYYPLFEMDICVYVLDTLSLTCITGCVEEYHIGNGACYSYRYDVELYQRIEHLIGKKLPLYKTEEEEVMQLMERVTEAQRYAKMVSIRRQILAT